MSVDVKAILEDADLRFTENRTHIILKLCPNCDGEDKVWYDKRKNLWQCFKCKGDGNDETKSGNLFTFLTKVVGLSSHQAKTLLQDGEEVRYVPESLPEPVTKEEVVVEP